MYGRGAADDKSGIVVHAAAIRALLADGLPPVSIKVVVEGEEECSTEHLPELVQGNADLLRADVAVIADGGNYRTGVPTLNSSIRGVTDIVVQVRVLPRAQHSGSYGGPIPDAITALARIIASLHHDDGSVAIEGLQRFGWTGMQIPEDEFREESGVLDQVELIGAGTLSDRLLTGPAVAVLGFDAPAIAGSSNQIVPFARARVSLRIAPGDDPVAARQALVDHLRSHAPWGVEVTFEGTSGFEAGHGHLVDTTRPASRAAMDALAQRLRARGDRDGIRRLDPARPDAHPDVPGDRDPDLGRDGRALLHPLRERERRALGGRAHHARGGAVPPEPRRGVRGSGC